MRRVITFKEKVINTLISFCGERKKPEVALYNQNLCLFHYDVTAFIGNIRGKLFVLAAHEFDACSSIIRHTEILGVPLCKSKYTDSQV